MMQDAHPPYLLLGPLGLPGANPSPSSLTVHARLLGSPHFTIRDNTARNRAGSRGFSYPEVTPIYPALVSRLFINEAAGRGCSWCTPSPGTACTASPSCCWESFAGRILCRAKLCRAMPSCAVPCHAMSP